MKMGGKGGRNGVGKQGWKTGRNKNRNKDGRLEEIKTETRKENWKK